MSCRLARKSITLTVDVDEGTLRVKTDDVDNGLMCSRVFHKAVGLRWCVSCYHAEDEVRIEHIA